MVKNAAIKVIDASKNTVEERLSRGLILIYTHMIFRPFDSLPRDVQNQT